MMLRNNNILIAVVAAALTTIPGTVHAGGGTVCIVTTICDPMEPQLVDCTSNTDANTFFQACCPKNLLTGPNFTCTKFGTAPTSAPETAVPIPITAPPVISEIVPFLTTVPVVTPTVAPRTAVPTPQPTRQPEAPTPQDQSYEVDDNGCVAYREGNTDDNCQNASGLGLFNGNIYSHSYQCTEGLGYACCDSTIYNESNVQDLGQCTRNYQEDDQGCIPDSDCNSDDCCANANGFTRHNFSYTCSKGEKYACCNSNTEYLSNVQDLGQCQRNTSSRRNLRRRIYTL